MGDLIYTIYYWGVIVLWFSLIVALGWYAAKGRWPVNKQRIILCTVAAWLMGGLVIGIPLMAIGWIAQRHRQKRQPKA